MAQNKLESSLQHILLNNIHNDSMVSKLFLPVDLVGSAIYDRGLINVLRLEILKLIENSFVYYFLLSIMKRKVFVIIVLMNDVIFSDSIASNTDPIQGSDMKGDILLEKKFFQLSYQKNL